MKPPMLAPDPATRRAVEKAGVALFAKQHAGMPFDIAAAITIAAYLDAMGQDIAAARVRRCLNTDEGGV
jgi:hypothetical protein